ncbi:unnamed protein product [Adineta steineri]|uniref:TIR domain-containing protein n=2 Tax=Adineta steineri TaxID=433720 RepID=A0A814WFR0_9BILA|nr:unnamed protein product [Adineta steineri]
MAYTKMSGDLNTMQNPSGSDEFIDTLKSLSVSQSLDTHGDVIEQLHTQLKRAVPNGFKENKAFAFTIIDNLYRIVPIFDRILSNNNENDNDFIQTKKFLATLVDSFNSVCFFEVLSLFRDNLSHLKTIFQTYISLFKETYFIENDKYDSLITCIVPVVGFSSILTPTTEDEIPEGLLSYLLTFVKSYWKCQHRELVIKAVFGLIKIFSKQPTLVPLIIRTGWPQACIQFLTESHTEKDPQSSYTIDYYICLIIQKLARHPNGVQVLNQLNCIKVLEESKERMKKNHTELQYKCLHFLQCMIYVLLTEADNIKHTTMLCDNQMCQTLKDLVTHTIEAANNEYLFHHCFHVSEMLTVLCKVFLNDDVLTKCMNENNQLFDCLSQLLIRFVNITSDANHIHQPTDNETLLTLTNLLWSISFHQCYHEKFQANSILMHTITNLTTSSSVNVSRQTMSIPRDLISLKKAAEGILWNLKSLSSSPRPTLNQQTEQRPLVMISYSHSDTTFCRELVENLSAHVPVWVDYKQARDAVAHSDDLWEEIARAMEMASVIVLIISKEYYDSKSCRQELSYASDTLKKRIVPIYAPNQLYRASGWLGIRIAGQKYIHFGRKPFDDAVKELASMVDTDQKPLVISSPPQHSQPQLPPPTPLCSSQSVPCSSRSAPCSSSKTMTNKIIAKEENKLMILNDWTAKDIRKWFDENHIHANLITLYADQFQNGTSLIIYARHLKLFYRYEYIRIFTKYYKLFHGKRLDTFDFITFVDALYRLRNEYDPNSNIEDNYEKHSEHQLLRKMKGATEGLTWL